MAQTLKFGNGTWATKKGSTLAFNDQDGNYKPLPFATTRATSATRVNKEGLIEVVENDRPRIDYTDSAKGALLLEPERINLVTYSEDFNNPNWIKSRSSITSTSTINPSGSVSSSYMYDDNTNGNHKIYSGTFSVTSGQNQSVSIFAKVGTLSTFRIRFARFDEADIGFSEVIFDLENGTTSSVEGTIIDYGNGWYRCIVTDAVNYTGLARVFLYLKDGVYTGTGTDYIEIWGAQTETNSSYATSYIPTEGSAVTRVADTASGSGNSEVFNDSEGVFMAEIANISENQTATVAFSLSDGSASNAVSVYYFGTSGLYYDVFNSDGTRSGSTPMTKIQQASNNKISLKYKSGDIALWVNGFEVNTNTGTLNLSGLSELNFDYGNGNFDFYGKTKEIAYYNTVLTDAELETLTSYRSLSELVTELNLNTL